MIFQPRRLASYPEICSEKALNSAGGSRNSISTTIFYENKLVLEHSRIGSPEQQTSVDQHSESGNSPARTISKTTYSTKTVPWFFHIICR